VVAIVIYSSHSPNPCQEINRTAASPSPRKTAAAAAEDADETLVQSQSRRRGRPCNLPHATTYVPCLFFLLFPPASSSSFRQIGMRWDTLRLIASSSLGNRPILQSTGPAGSSAGQVWIHARSPCTYKSLLFRCRSIIRGRAGGRESRRRVEHSCDARGCRTESSMIADESNPPSFSRTTAPDFSCPIFMVRRYTKSPLCIPWTTSPLLFHPFAFFFSGFHFP
jgi:hypothetical protein